MDEQQKNKRYDTMQGKQELKKSFFNTNLWLWIAGIFLLLGFLCIKISDKLFIIFIGICLGAICIWERYNKKYTVMIKTMAGQALQRMPFLSDVEYNATGGFAQKDICETGMLRKGDKYEMGDLISAKCNDVPFRMCDLKIYTCKTRNDGVTDSKSFFVGKFVVFQLKKQFDSSVIIATKNFPALGNGVPESFLPPTSQPQNTVTGPAPSVFTQQQHTAEPQDAVTAQAEAQIAAQEAALEAAANATEAAIEAAEANAYHDSVVEQAEAQIAAEEGTDVIPGGPFKDITNAMLSSTGGFRVLSSDGNENSNVFINELFTSLITVYNELKAPFVMMFRENKIFFAIHDQKDIFETPVSGKPYAEQEEERFRKEMEFLPMIESKIVEYYV